MAEAAAAGRGFAVGIRVPIVPGAIPFDLPNGGDKHWTCNPMARWAGQALAAAGPAFEIGAGR